jgi:hypothetical protein
VGGANIGGGLALLVGPLLIVGVLVVAGRMPHRLRPVPLTRRGVWTGAVVALGLAMFVASGVATANHREPGIPLPHHYAKVQVGQTRAVVHDILGGPPESYDSLVFPEPNPPGQRCEYYVGRADEGSTKTGHDIAYYRFCYQHKILVSKARRY